MLAGDASNRKYFRLHRPDGSTAVLMDADPAKGEDVRPFVHVARHLSGLGLSAPRLLAADDRNGFLLLEDLGDALFARVIPAAPDLEIPLYQAATEALITLHAHPVASGLKAYDAATMTPLAGLAWVWYRRGILGDQAGIVPFSTAFAPLLAQIAPTQPVMILRDYHAENLLWLPDRTGAARVGLLDFQDAMTGHPAYDLVSLLQDARRDVPASVERAMIAHYIGRTGQEAGFDAAYHLLGVQRNLRILGVFARLSLRDAKPHYINLIPRVWGHLDRSLSHPALAPVADLIRHSLPEPTPDLLQRLRDQWGTVPTP
jgi:aminoglycoside/choline kinase family phosphotransferase